MVVATGLALALPGVAAASPSIESRCAAIWLRHGLWWCRHRCLPRARAARYTLNGWTITTTDAEGRSDTRLFYFFPDSNDVIGVGGSTLSRRR